MNELNRQLNSIFTVHKKIPLPTTVGCVVDWSWLVDWCFTAEKLVPVHSEEGKPGWSEHSASPQTPLPTTGLGLQSRDWNHSRREF